MLKIYIGLPSAVAAVVGTSLLVGPVGLSAAVTKQVTFNDRLVG